MQNEALNQDINNFYRDNNEHLDLIATELATRHSYHELENLAQAIRTQTLAEYLTAGKSVKTTPELQAMIFAIQVKLAKLKTMQTSDATILATALTSLTGIIQTHINTLKAQHSEKQVATVINLIKTSASSISYYLRKQLSDLGSYIEHTDFVRKTLPALFSFNSHKHNTNHVLTRKIATKQESTIAEPEKRNFLGMLYDLCTKKNTATTSTPNIPSNPYRRYK